MLLTTSIRSIHAALIRVESSRLGRIFRVYFPTARLPWIPENKFRYARHLTFGWVWAQIFGFQSSDAYSSARVLSQFSSWISGNNFWVLIWVRISSQDFKLARVRLAKFTDMRTSEACEARSIPMKGLNFEIPLSYECSRAETRLWFRRRAGSYHINHLLTPTCNNW